MRRPIWRVAVVFGFVALAIVGTQAASAAGAGASGVCAQRPTAPPTLPGEFIISDFVVFVDSTGVVWVKLYPQTPWGVVPPSEWFSDYVQIAISETEVNPIPTIVGFQTHDGLSETFSFEGSTAGPAVEGYIMNDGALLFNTGLTHGGGPLNLNLNSGFLPTEDGQFQNSAADHVVDPLDVATSDDPLHFDDEFPAYNLMTGTPVDPPTVVTSTTTTTTIHPTTQERPHHSTTARDKTCWWCWGIVFLFFSFLLCVLFTRMKTYEWWTCWLPWFLVIFIWVPFLLAGMWWWRPAWWWVPLLAWGPLIIGYTWYWARHRSWWHPWHWYVVGGYLAALLVGSLIVRAPEWGLLFPLFWLPWVGFYMWFRALRQPWWHRWMYLLFGAYIAWIFVWVAWLSPWWAWWLPVAFCSLTVWWFVSQGQSWQEIIGPKWCWLFPFAMLPFYAWWIPLWAPWWCYVIALFFTEALFCCAFTHFKIEEWWTWWLVWFLTIFVWVPFLLAGLWFFRPNWWGWALVPWFVGIIAGVAFWATRRSWWQRWMLYPVVGYLLVAQGVAFAVGSPEWGLLFPVFWVPLAGLYVWYRARRQPWWHPWMFILFAAFAVWLFIWVIWLTPWWGWWFPVVFVATATWWFLAHGYDEMTIRHKLCWILPFSALPWMCYMVALECLTT